MQCEDPSGRTRSQRLVIDVFRIVGEHRPDEKGSSGADPGFRAIFDHLDCATVGLQCGVPIVAPSEHRSARFKKRGIRSNQEQGVAKLESDGPARCSCLVSSAWWPGPPPIPRCRPPRATNRVTRPPRRSPPQEAARGFWIRAWGQRETALRGTGRSNDPAPWPGFLEGGLDDPRHSRRNQLAFHRTPDPDVHVFRSGHSSVELGSSSVTR